MKVEINRRKSGKEIQGNQRLNQQVKKKKSQRKSECIKTNEKKT